MVADMAADMEAHMVGDLEVDEMADKKIEGTQFGKKKKGTQFGKKKKGTQFDDRVGVHGGRLIGPKLFRPSIC